MRRITDLFRYPIKGMSPEALNQVLLRVGQGFHRDREYAFTNGGWVFDAAHYEPRPKMDFLMLMLNEQLALLKTRLDDDTHTVHVHAPGGERMAARIDDPAQVALLEDFVAGHLAGKLKGRPRFVHAGSQRFTDVAVVSPALMRSISLINRASVRELGERMGAELDPLRFRANVYFDGGAAWEELDWLGKEVLIGEARAKVVMKTRRCAATNVNPATGVRDLGVPQALMKHYKHMDLGVYAEILGEGALRPGDSLRLAG